MIVAWTYGAVAQQPLYLGLGALLDWSGPGTAAPTPPGPTPTPPEPTPEPAPGLTPAAVVDWDTLAAVRALILAATAVEPVAVVDYDTLAAVRSLVMATVNLAAMFSLGPQAGELKSPQALPYLQIACKLESRMLAGAVRGWLDKRRVTLTVRGTEDQVVAGLGALKAIFNRRTVLTYPSGDIFIQWWPDGDAKLGPAQGDAARKDGLDIWEGSMEAIVVSQRDE